MLKKILIATIAVLTLSGCTLHKVTNAQEICAQAKRQQIYNATSPSSAQDPQYLTQAQHANLHTTLATC